MKVKGIIYLAEATIIMENDKLYIEPGAKLAPITRIPNISWVVARDSVKVNVYTTEERIECSSPSMAATIVCEHAQNVWKVWKNFGGEHIDVYRQILEVINEE